jgi:osmotically-inducible protein OsmY
MRYRRMTTTRVPRASILAAAIVLAVAAWSDVSPTRAATANTATDKRILADIQSRILDARAGFFLDVEIDIVKGDVMLTGHVREAQTKTRAAALIRSVSGVSTVVNEIRSERPPTLSRRSDQLETERRISAALYRIFRKRLPAIAIRVVGDTAYIFGETSSQWVHSQVFKAVKKVKGVGRIVDHLHIAQSTRER